MAGGESGEVTVTGDAVILAAGSVPRTIPGFDVDGDAWNGEDLSIYCAEDKQIPANPTASTTSELSHEQSIENDPRHPAHQAEPAAHPDLPDGEVPPIQPGHLLQPAADRRRG